MMNRLTSVVLVVFLLAASFARPASAQSTGTVAGTVTDADTGAPLEGVNVVVETAPAASSTGTATNADGRFRLAVPTGEQALAFRFVGYAPVTRTVFVRNGRTATLNVRLSSAPIGLAGVEVSALRPDLQPTERLDQQRVQEANVADAGGLMRSMPGVDAVRRGPVGLDPNVRGLSETQVGVYIGGLRTFPAGPGRMDTPLSHIDPSTIERIDVVKGPYALTWGPGNMSAVRVEQRGEDPPPTPLTGSVHTGYDTNRQSVETSGFAMGRQGRWFYSANGAWREGNDYTSGSGRAIAGDFRSAEGRGRIGVDLSARSTLSFTGSYQDQDDIDYPGRMLHAEYFRTGMGQLKYTFEQGSGRLRAVEARVGAQQTLHRMTNRTKPSYDRGMRVEMPTEVQNLNGRVAVDLVPAPLWDVTVGGDVLHTFRDATRTRSMVDMDMVNREEPWPGVTLTQAGVFAQSTRRVGWLRLSGTTRLDVARADVNNPTDLFLSTLAPSTDLQQNDVMFSGALTAALPLSDAWTVSVGGGSVARPPDALERYADRVPAAKSQMSAEFQGNPLVNPERSTQLDLWIEGSSARWSLNVNGFARWIDDSITFAESDIEPVLPMSPAVYRYTNGEATFYGAEASGSVTPLPRVTLRASGSYLWGRDDAFDEPAFGVAPAAGEVALRWSPVLGLPSVRNAFLESTVRFVDTQDRVATVRGESPTDGYTLVGLGSGVRVLNRVQLQLGVENLLDVAYANHLNAVNPFRGVQVAEPGRMFTMDVTVAF